MSSFVGDIACKVDSKGRISFPAIFKKQLSSGARGKFILKKDIFANCLVLYPYDEWQKQIQIIRQKINQFNQKHSQFLRRFFSDTAEITLDTNNRLLIPRRFLEMVGIADEAYLVGLDNKIEIWQKEEFLTNHLPEDEYIKLAQEILGNDKL